MFRIMTDAVVLAMLAGFTVTDVRSMRIPWPVTVAVGVVGIGLRLALAEPVLAGLWGALPGLILLLISRLCGEALGRGDCFTLMACGVVMGFGRTFALLSVALVFSALWAVLLLARGKGGMKQRFPFMPFLLAAQVCRFFVS